MHGRGSWADQSKSDCVRKEARAEEMAPLGQSYATDPPAAGSRGWRARRGESENFVSGKLRTEQLREAHLTFTQSVALVSIPVLGPQMQTSARKHLQNAHQAPCCLLLNSRLPPLPPFASGHCGNWRPQEAAEHPG